MADDASAATRIETNFERIRRLETEARSAADQEKNQLIADLGDVAARCAAVATLQSVKPGVRSELEGLGRLLEEKLQIIASIQTRAD